MNSLNKVRQEMQRLAKPVKAKILQKFFKTDKGEYGEGDVFLGLMVPQTRKLVKKYWNSLKLKEITALLQSKTHEERLLALLILVERFKQGDVNEQQKIYKFYLQHTKYINNWDLVDLSAPNIVGVYLLGKPHQILYKLIKSKNLWERRIAILSCFTFIRNRQFTDTLRLVKILLADQHNLIHKAAGWMLREIGKRDNLVLKKFLGKYYKVMPRTMLRYAIERLPENLRKNHLLGKV